MSSLLHELHPALSDLLPIARQALGDARRHHQRHELEVEQRNGADGTPTMLVDELVEERLLEAAARHRVNVLSEEAGFVDHGSATTLVIDPVDGSANAAAGVPACCVSIAVAVDARLTQAVTHALDTGQSWCAANDGRSEGPDGRVLSTSQCTDLADAAVSLLRPHPHTANTWWEITRRAQRIRVLSCSTLDIALVAHGAIDAFADPGSDTHRLVDLAAGSVFAAAGAGHLSDLHERLIEFDPDLTRRWSGLFAATPELLDQLRDAASPT